MRLNAQKSTATPEGRTERMRRGRASALALRMAYPSVQQLRLDLNFEGAHPPAAQSHLLYPPARAFFAFPCPHADCDGEFDLTAVVQRTVADKAHASRGTIVCSGLRAFDHGSKQPCGLHLNYSVTALL